MAAPDYVSSGTALAELDSSITITLPATINANDIVVIVAAYRGASTVTLDTPTHATLTFAAVQAQSGGTISQQKVFWARAAGGEGGSTVTVTKSSGTLLFIAQSHVFSPCIVTGNPYDETAGALQENTIDSATVTFEAMTLGGDERLIVISYFEADNDTTPGNFTTVDVTFTARDDFATATGLDGRIKLTTGPNAAGDTDIATTTATQPASDQYSLQQFALLPVAGGGTAHTLAATTAAVSTVAGALKRGVLMAAAPAAVSTLAGALSAGLTLAAAPTAISTATAALSLTFALAGSPGSESAVAAQLSLAAALEAAAAAVSTASAELTTEAGAGEERGHAWRLLVIGR